MSSCNNNNNSRPLCKNCANEQTEPGRKYCKDCLCGAFVYHQKYGEYRVCGRPWTTCEEHKHVHFCPCGHPDRDDPCQQCRCDNCTERVGVDNLDENKLCCRCRQYPGHCLEYGRNGCQESPFEGSDYCWIHLCKHCRANRREPGQKHGFCKDCYAK